MLLTVGLIISDFFTRVVVQVEDRHDAGSAAKLTRISGTLNVAASAGKSPGSKLGQAKTFPDLNFLRIYSKIPAAL